MIRQDPSATLRADVHESPQKRGFLPSRAGSAGCFVETNSNQGNSELRFYLQMVSRLAASAYVFNNCIF